MCGCTAYVWLHRLRVIAPFTEKETARLSSDFFLSWIFKSQSKDR